MSNMAFSKVSHVIFDMDGVLLDTEKLYKKCIEELAANYGKIYTSEVRAKVLGTVERDTARIVISELDLPISIDEFLIQYEQLTKRCLGQAELMEGAERLVRHLSKNGVPIAVATSSSLASIERKIATHKELFALFHHIVSGSSDKEVKKGKPAPDIFLVCASRFPDVPPVEKCLVLEDAPNGVVAGRSAGMQVVMLPDPSIPEELRKPATHVVNSLLDFKPELFGLPAFEN